MEKTSKYGTLVSSFLCVYFQITNLSPMPSPTSIRAAALSGLSKLLNKEDCHLRSLCVTDSKLKEQTTILLEALEDNTSLTKLDIRFVVHCYA